MTIASGVLAWFCLAAFLFYARALGKQIDAVGRLARQTSQDLADHVLDHSTFSSIYVLRDDANEGEESNHAGEKQEGTEERAVPVR